MSSKWSEDDVITMAHGSGGLAMQQLLESLFLPLFDNPALNAREDQARLPLCSFNRRC